jgi:hypothetical protein
VTRSTAGEAYTGTLRLGSDGDRSGCFLGSLSSCIEKFTESQKVSVNEWKGGHWSTPEWSRSVHETTAYAEGVRAHVADLSKAGACLTI